MPYLCLCHGRVMFRCWNLENKLIRKSLFIFRLIPETALRPSLRKKTWNVSRKYISASCFYPAFHDVSIYHTCRLRAIFDLQNDLREWVKVFVCFTSLLIDLFFNSVTNLVIGSEFGINTSRICVIKRSDIKCKQCFTFAVGKWLSDWSI